MKGMTYQLFGLITAIPCALHAQTPWINEFHYDNTGTDAGEFVEIVAPFDLTDLATVRLTLYNGGDGKAYGTSHLLSSFDQGMTLDGVTFYSKNISLQNGGPDGLALDLGGNVLQFLSYEGNFQAANGPATGLTSTDIAVFESDPGTGVGASLGLRGNGSSPADFTWGAFGTDSRGGLNEGQSMIPEPGEWTLLMTGGLTLFALGRRRRRALAVTIQ